MHERHFIDHAMIFREISPELASGVIFYIHGLGESSLCFQKLMSNQAFSDYRQIAPDLPGYGRTPWMDQKFSVFDYADHVGKWLSKCTFTNIVVIGHSMGGVIGQILCERYPETVNAFINVEGNISIGDCAYSGIAASQSIDAFISDGFDALRQTCYEQGNHDLALRGYYTSLRFADPRQFYKNSVDLVGVSREQTMAKRFSELRLRKRYIAGSPNGICRQSLNLLDHSECPVSIIEDSGHWPFLDQEKRFIEIVKIFLDSGF
ncbi:alpha/beta hydrolase [bacterium]|nr:alpha/beta hydrolase [candidate division CSSED10-310 bacterium]